MHWVQALIEHRQCLAIMGPTASGKSDLSMRLSAELPVEIISVDSALIYRGMDIGTAKPTKEEMAQVPHHLIDTHDASESYSASNFVEDVNALVQAIFERQRLPLLVGGTMMYFNALQQGLSELPSANKAIREKWLETWAKTPQRLHEALAKVDPESAQRIHQNDPQRLVRALEVYELTGKTLSALRAEPKKGLQEFELLKVALIPEDRARLHQQIEKRFMQMLEQGFLNEVKQFYGRGDLDVDMTSMRSVGYRQAWLFLAGEYDYQTFIDKSLVATRQLAKRQLTWLRKERDVLVMDPYQTSPEHRVQAVLAYLSEQAKQGSVDE